MNKIKLPSFVTFKNFNDETIDLISKKELEIDKLNAVLSYRMFLDIFNSNPELKSLKISSHVKSFGVLVLADVHATFFDGRIVKNPASIFSLICDIVGYVNHQRMIDVCDFEVGRDIESCNKLKAVFDIKDLSDEDVYKMIDGDFLSVKNDVFATFNEISKLHKQIVVIKILTLFKKNNNLKRINLEVDVNIIGTQNVCIKVFFDDMGVDDRCIIGKIKEILDNKKLYDPDSFSYSLITNIDKNNFSDIKYLIKCIMHDDSLNDFSSVLEKEMLEEKIKLSVNDGKFKKI